MRVQRTTTEVRPFEGRRGARIRILAPETRDIALPAAGVVVGADPSCDLVLSDRAVSRRHLAIVPAPTGFEVRDLGSRNGTWLDGVSITQAIAPIGAVLRAGSTLLELLPEEENGEIPPSPHERFGELIGSTRAMRVAFTALERASAHDVPILLLGESGTGKELAARGVHDASPRRSGPFVVFDCGAAKDTLIESDLFGHLRGAFTGALETRAGAFARAHGGTLFLDELGDMPLAVQSKLLRVIQTGEVQPLGSSTSQRFDVRIVAATHHDLYQEVEQGTFRGDLYYRLAVVEVALPPLRRRRDDIPALVARFLDKLGADVGTPAGPALDRLVAFSWPGNVRELRNVIARAVALAPPGAQFADMPFLLRGGLASTEDEPLARADVTYHEAKDALLERFERDYLRDLVRRAGDNVSLAARLAGLDRKYLYKLLEKVGLAPRRA